MEDSFGHHISYLRVSVTDRCNERCRYCMPEEEQVWTPKDEVLTFEEMLRVIRVGAGLGIQKIRVTGGEPLTRPGIAEFCREISQISGIRQLGISTNGTLLSKMESGRTLAEALRGAGVQSLNLSLDSLDPVVYQKTTGRDLLPKVLEGISAAKEAGFTQLRFNCVLIKGQTEGEMLNLIEFARTQEALLRFIELMPVSTRDVIREDSFLSTLAAKRLVEQHYGLLQARADYKTNGPAQYHEIPATGQKIGFIGAMTNLHFCESCNKLRLTSDGKIRPCLGSYLEFDIRTALRKGCSDEQLVQHLLHAVARKPKEHDFRANYQPNRKMIAIGG